MSKQKADRNRSNVIKNNWFILRLAFKEAPLYTFIAIQRDTYHQTIVFIEHIYMIAYIVNCIQYQAPFWHAALFIGCVFTGVILYNVGIHYFEHVLTPIGIERINRGIRLKLYKKASEIDLECYDNPEFYTDFVWSMSEATDRVNKVIGTISNCLGSFIGMLITGAFVFTTDRLGVLFAVTAFLLTFVIRVKSNKLQIGLDTEMRPIQRKRDYINRVFYLNDYVKDIRLSNIKKKLYDDFLASNKDLERIAKKKTKLLAVNEFILNFVCNSFIFDGIYLVYLLYRTIVQSALSYGWMMGVYNSAGRLKSNLRNFALTIPEFQEHSLYIDKILKFLNYDIKIKNSGKALPFPKGAGTIELRNVSFSYTKGGRPILKNVNLTIHPGEKIALVGYNGAGKTTLVKLLMRLYDPTEGEILYSGVNIKDYDLAEYRNSFGAVFQDYQLFSSTLGENITMDTAEIDREKAVKALAESEFIGKYTALENGLETPVTKEFDENGANLSGGESQKLAISRVLYKDSPNIILDEPSSALDPISEYKLNTTMLHISHHRTVIFISHRLSTTKMADRIYMLEKGGIIEEGNHNELIRLDGKYAQMFNLQAEKYR